MNPLRKKIEAVMTGSSAAPFSSGFESLLYLMSLGYAGAATVRALFYAKGLFKSRKLPCTVVSIGNLAVGGTGKTPLTIYVADFFRQLGYRVAVISRGYGGGKEGIGGIVSDGQSLLMGPREAGDEPYLMASKLERVPVLVGKNRFTMGMLAVREFRAQILVLDDAFQHRQVHRDLDLVLLDAARPLGNGYVLPRGILREPSRQLARGDAFILTRSGQAVQSRADQALLEVLTGGKPVFRCNHVPDMVTRATSHPVSTPVSRRSACDPDVLKGRRILAFSGIARNDSFQATIEGLGCQVVKSLTFPDHHPYSASDLERIFQVAAQYRVDYLVTTEKDRVRIVEHGMAWPIELLTVGIRMSFDDEAAFQGFLVKMITEFIEPV